MGQNKRDPTQKAAGTCVQVHHPMSGRQHRASIAAHGGGVYIDPCVHSNPRTTRRHPPKKTWNLHRCLVHNKQVIICGEGTRQLARRSSFSACDSSLPSSLPPPRPSSRLHCFVFAKKDVARDIHKGAPFPLAERPPACYNMKRMDAPPPPAQSLNQPSTLNTVAGPKYLTPNLSKTSPGVALATFLAVGSSSTGWLITCLPPPIPIPSHSNTVGIDERPSGI